MRANNIIAVATLLALSGMGGVGRHYGSFSRQGRDEDLLLDTNISLDQDDPEVKEAVSAQAKAQIKRDRKAAKRLKDAA